MILGFKKQFVPYVLDGSKRHTIRAGERWKVGMRADLFEESRRRKVYDANGVQVSGMRLLFRDQVSKVEPIRISCSSSLTGLVPLHERTSIVIGDEVLSLDELDAFAWRDGFRRPDLLPQGAPQAWGCFFEMVCFWETTHGFGSKMLSFDGQLVHWGYTQRFQKYIKKGVRP